MFCLKDIKLSSGNLLATTLSYIRTALSTTNCDHPHIADAVLNHKSGTIRGVAAVYQRYRYGDEARHALKAWDEHVAAIVTGKAPPSNVVPLVG